MYRGVAMRLRIRDLREDRNLQQKDIAKYLNVHQTTYSSYENGKLNLPISALDKLADFYNTSMDYLMGRTNNPDPYE